MSTVWAPFKAPGIGKWADGANSAGWNRTIEFASVRDLTQKMGRIGGLKGKVTRLGIVAHGDQQGLVQLDRKLTVGSVGSFRADWQELRLYLTSNAMLAFYSCVAGAGEPGSRLLVALSKELPGRTVVGFTILGETDASEGLSGLSPQTPGRVREAPHGLGSGRKGAEGLMTPWHYSAKWARDGKIVRSPPIERAKGNRCANPACPGHSSALHHCAGWSG